MWYPLACEVVFACFMLAIGKGTRSPTTLGCLAVRESLGNAFCFCLILLLAFLQLSLQRYRRSTTAPMLPQGNRAAGSADFRRRFRRWSYA